ncbi:recombinase family protein [Ponticoccus gilvus]|nr:recombinase family protein [Enemella evansiae]
MKFVTYLRISTERQGQSGLGLEAQRAAVAARLPGRGGVVAEFVEVESGNQSDRPELAWALAAAKARGGKLGWSIPERASEQRQAVRKGAAVNKARALAHAEKVLPMAEQIRAGGASLRQIAAELNARGIKTARGGTWHAATVSNMLTLGRVPHGDVRG